MKSTAGSAKQVRKFRPCSRKFRPSSGISGLLEKRLSHIRETSLEGSRNFCRKFAPDISDGPEIPVVRPEVPPLELFRGNMAKSYLGNLSGGIPELLPEVCPGYFRWAGNSGRKAGSSFPRTISGKYG